MRIRTTAAVLAGALALVTGCTGDPPRTTPTPGPASTTSAGSASPSPSATTSPDAPPATPLPLPSVAVTGTADLVSGLDAPWGVALLPDGAALVTLRDRAEVVMLRAGAVSVLGGAGAQALAAGTRTGGEGGLLGIAVPPADAATTAAPAAPTDVFLYRTAPGGNEILRAGFDGAGLTGLEVVLDGIPAARNHNGGRIAFGPDGYLYVATGDAGNPATAQDPASLGGKILRLTSDGAPAPGNPDPGSPVWSLGHRNVQGLGWTADGAMLASEFGQNTWDELNVIRAGANYGWPAVEGAGDGDPAYTDPVATWPTSEASPSGIAVTGEGVYLAGLRGQRLWRVPLAAPGSDGVVDGEPQALLAGELGRLRAVTVAPDGALWVVTNNTDGRGDPRPGDDRIVRVTVG